MHFVRSIIVGIFGVLGVYGRGICREPGFSFLNDPAWLAPLKGWWTQVLSSRYVVTTDLIDMNCAGVDVQVNGNTLTVSRHAIQHGYPWRTVNETYILKDPQWIDGLITFHHGGRYDLGYQLRCLRNDLVVWTGTDNMTLLVWTLDADIFQTNLYHDVLAYLRTIDYHGGYKEPVVTFNHTVCK